MSAHRAAGRGRGKSFAHSKHSGQSLPALFQCQPQAVTSYRSNAIRPERGDVANEWERRIRAVARELETAERDADDARQAFWDVLAAAHDDGVSLTAIGDMLG